MLTKVQIAEQKFAPGGGLNTINDPFEIGENQTPDSANVFFYDDNTIGKRYGRELLNLSPTGATDNCNGLFDYGVSPGVRKLMGMFGTTLYKMDDLDGTWDSLDPSRTDCIHYFERSTANLIICNENKDIIEYWDGSAGSTSTLNTSAPRAKIPKTFQGYLFLANTTTNARRIYYEDESTITSGDYGEYFTIPSSSDDEVFQLIEYNGRLYATLRGEWYRISFIGGSAIFDNKRVSSVVGAVPRTVQVVSIPRVGEVIMYLGWNRKIYVFDESSSYPISLNYEKDNNLSTIFLDNINQGGLINAHATVDTNKNLYRLYAPIGADATITHSFNISLDSLSCSVMDNQKYLSSCMAEDSGKRRWHIVGGYNGDAYKLDRIYIDEVPMNNAEFGPDGTLVSIESYIRSAGGFTGGTATAGAADYIEDSAVNFTTQGVVANDTVLNKTDGLKKIITSISNGAGTNARLNATAISGTAADVFRVYKNLFINDNESIYIGSKIKFNTIIIDLLTNASATITPSVLYSSDSAGAYTAVSGLVDGTSGFTKSGTIIFTIPSAWTLTAKDDGNNAFGDTTTYYYVKIQRTADTLTTTPVIVMVKIGIAVNDYYTSPSIFGKYVSALKKGQRMNMYFSAVANYKLRFYDKKDSDRTWTKRTDLPIYNVGDDFVGETWALSSVILGSNKNFVEQSVEIPQVTNVYQYKIDSNSSTKMPWKLNKTEIAGMALGIGSSYNKIR